MKITGTITGSIDKHGRLVLRADAEDRATMRAEVAEGESLDDAVEERMRESLFYNGPFQSVDPSETGDLTDAPMIGVKDEDDNVIIRFAYMDYQILDWREEIMETGEVTWQGGFVDRDGTPQELRSYLCLPAAD